MSISYNTSIPRQGLVFAWDGLNPKSWNGISNTHTDLLSITTGTKTGANSLTYTGGHVDFTGGGTRVCYVSFPDVDNTVPTNNQGTWMWAHYFEDAGDIDHPNFGKETGNSWDGQNGFVFGTGFGTDGPRWGIGGTAYTIYSTTGGATGDYRPNVWQIYCVTYLRNTTNGLKTYLLDSNGMRLVDQRNTPDSAIGSNTNNLQIGATNSRGGNWNGRMDFVYMWNRALTEDEVFRSINAVRSRVDL